MLTEKAYECCHEAGHAVARIIIGDAVLGIYINPNAPDRPGERGRTKIKHRERERRRCDGYVRNCSADPLDTDSCFSLGPDCPDCQDYCKNQVAARLAGGAATECLMRDEHARRGAQMTQMDEEDIKKEFCCYPPLGSIRSAAELRAGSLVVQEREAIDAFTQALVENDGSLGGPEATRIVREHFSGSTFYLSL
jgi:hypothetical protein